MDYGNPYVQMVNDTALKYGVDPTLALGVANQESGFNQKATSGAGALGVMQLMPDTAKSLGVDPTDASQNIDGGVRYLKQMLDRYNGDTQLGLAAYNAGPGRVDDYVNKGRVLPNETLNYVKSISGNPIKAAFNGNTTMPTQGSLFPAQPDAPQAPTLFGGNPTPVGMVGNLARMIGVGSEPELGRRIQNAGAALMSVGNFGKPGMAGAAMMQEAANQPHFNVVTDALGNRIMFDTRNGMPVARNGVPFNNAAGANAAAPGGDTSRPTALNQSPLAQASQAKADADMSAKKMEALDDAAAQAQNLIDINNMAMAYSKNPNTVQGPGLWNMLKEHVARATGGSVGGVDLPTQESLEKINSQLVSQMLSAQKGVRFAAPEIKFGQTASADTEKPAATNQQIYSDNIQNARRAIAIRDIARAHYSAGYSLNGPEFSKAVQDYQTANPVYQPDVVKPNSGSANRPPLSSFEQK